jgi:hypothetical protein
VDLRVTDDLLATRVPWACAWREGSMAPKQFSRGLCIHLAPPPPPQRRPERFPQAKQHDCLDISGMGCLNLSPERLPVPGRGRTGLLRAQPDLLSILFASS